jgi:hypothetical protein
MTRSLMARSLSAWMLVVPALGCSAGAAERHDAADTSMSLAKAPVAQGGTAGVASTRMPPAPKPPAHAVELISVAELCTPREASGVRLGVAITQPACENKACGEACEWCSTSDCTTNGRFFACSLESLCVEVAPPTAR